MVVRAERVNFDRRVALFGLDTDTAFTTAPLCTIFIQFHAFDVVFLRPHHYHLRAWYQVLSVNVTIPVRNLGTSLITVLLFQFEQFRANNFIYSLRPR